MRFRGSSDNYPSARTLAEARGYDPNPDDILPPALILMAAPGVDVLTAFAAEVAAAREAAAWPICDEHEQPIDPEDTAPSCGAHTLCVPCFDTSNFHCPECHRVRKELDA